MPDLSSPTGGQGAVQLKQGDFRQNANAAGEEHTVTFFGIDELDPLKGKISWVSPVARALTKAREGDLVTLQTPLGPEELEVLSVVYPEPADD